MHRQVLLIRKKTGMWRLYTPLIAKKSSTRHPNSTKNLPDSHIKAGWIMIKEYISPQTEIIAVLSDAAVLSVSVNSPTLEDFTVSEGEW